jgi:hypothetical protein
MAVGLTTLACVAVDGLPSTGAVPRLAIMQRYVTREDAECSVVTDRASTYAGIGRHRKPRASWIGRY